MLRAEGQPLNAGKIADFGGLDRKEVDKAMAQLKKEEKIVSPKRCYWKPAKGIPPVAVREETEAALVRLSKKN